MNCADPALTDSQYTLTGATKRRVKHTLSHVPTRAHTSCHQHLAITTIKLGIMMLTIHVGLHKTGSTAIQQYLAHAPRRTTRQLAYLGRDNLLGSEGFQVPTNRKRGRSRALEVLANDRDVVISSEGFLGRGWSMYANARHNALAMRDHFADHTDFQVVVYLRPQYQWFESAYTQFVQEGNCEPPEEFVGRLLETRYAAYSSLIDDLISVLGSGRLVVRAYTDGTNAVADFLGLIDLPSHSSLDFLPRANVSITPQQVQLLRRINESTNDTTLKHQGRWFFQNISVGEQSQELSVLPEDLQQELIKLTHSDWQALFIAVQGTRFAEPLILQQVAEKAAHAAVRPFVGVPAMQDAVIREASRSLATAIPLVWNQNRQVKPRAQRMVSRVRNKVATDPADLLPAARRFISARVSLAREKRKPATRI